MTAATAGTEIVTTSHALVASTSAWGGATLDATLARISATAATHVQLAVGTRPEPDPMATIDRWRDRYTFLAHHTVALGPCRVLRPGLAVSPALASALVEAGVRRYSAHPPTRRQLGTEREMFAWAAAWRDALGEAGIDFAVETMYPLRTTPERARFGRHHLASAPDVHRFLAWAAAHGWDRPLVIDLAHLHIGWRHHQWTEREVLDLLDADVADEIHVSANDGMTDAHQAVPTGHPVARWLAGCDRNFAYVVDEVRRPLVDGRQR